MKPNLLRRISVRRIPVRRTHRWNHVGLCFGPLPQWLCIGLFLLAFHVRGEVMSAGGTDVGSGGFAVINTGPDSHGDVQLYDFWEWTSRLSTKIEMGPGPTYQEHLSYVLDRLKRLDLPLALKLQEKVKELLPRMDNSLLDRVRFADPKDYTNLLDPPPPYKRESFALFVAWPGPGELKYMFRKEIWDQAPATVRAGIILHELLYDEAVKRGERTSDSTRRFNALISSDLMNNLSPEQYFDHKFRDELLYFEKAEYHLRSFGLEWKKILSTIRDPKTLTLTMSGALRSLVIIMAQPTANPNIFVNLRELSDSLIFTYSEGLYAPLFVFQLVDPKMDNIPGCHPTRCPSIGEYLMLNKKWLSHNHWDKAVERTLDKIGSAKSRFVRHQKSNLRQAGSSSTL